MELQEVRSLIREIRTNIQKVIVGKDALIDLVLVALMSKGHVLLEDVPGTGKTMLAKSLAKSLSADYRRIQFTPDLLPSDVSGLNIYNQKTGDFEFRAGPVFTQILLADEINRATPRTQSALLEAMEEKQVTIDGVTRALARPFFAIATQNPVETQGTFPLPEAQLDRFFMKLKMGYPSTHEAMDILSRFLAENPLDTLEAVASAEQIVAAQALVPQVRVSPAVLGYVVDLVEHTRRMEIVSLGVSPRGSQVLLRASQVYALIQDRDFVIPDDVKAVAGPVMGHRMIVKSTYGARGSSSDEAVRELLANTPVPTEDFIKEKK